MLKRIRPSIGSAHVIALLALFVALGGGYAMAVSGAGSLQKRGEVGIDSDPDDIRTLTGIGAIQAQCISGDVFLRLRNNSGEALNVDGWDNSGGGEAISLFNNPNNSSGEFASPAGPGQSNSQVHISPVNGTTHPQADVNIAVDATGDCDTTHVIVLALTTES